jgi:D-alanyl-D-alanine carboxypeptidase
MTTPRARLISAVLVTITTVLLSAASALANPAVDHRSDATLRTLAASVTAAGVPGALARVQEDRGVRQAAAGVADLATGAPLRPEARFRAGSVTKAFVATVVLQLVGEGRLSLDEPIDRHLPGLVADGGRITVRHLLNHTSGLYDYTQDPTVLTGIAVNRVFTPRELVAIAESHPRQSTPGSPGRTPTPTTSSPASSWKPSPRPGWAGCCSGGSSSP